MSCGKNKSEKLNRKNNILTIPNILSMFRIVLIPVIAWLYIHNYNYYAVAVLVLSGITDIIDGFIARKFDMISDFGKILDPIADKLTQVVTIFCLISKFKYMCAPFLLLIIKEVFLGIQGLFVVKKTKVVKSANWHGKATTFLLYFMMIIHIVWIDIPSTVSDMTIGACLSFMMLSFVLYIIRNVNQLQEQKNI